ncbi:Phosphate transporter [Quillaja saponaria]|uniref:Phosphate transporter n=1 Tax=Quillaja saponaria TaxID=32244 RepID=A0AAD7LKF6_QUISA|nr:Phosphate transporter [Quillaja saponaria]
MASTSQAVFLALENAKTQLYQYKAIVIAGMGFFSDAYGLFCLTAVTKLTGLLYYYDPSCPHLGKLPGNMNNAITGLLYVETWQGNSSLAGLGTNCKKKVYGVTLITMSYTNNTDKTQQAIVALSEVNMTGFLVTFLVPETKGLLLEAISGEDKGPDDKVSES